MYSAMADEWRERCFDLMDAIDSLDVITLLEEHVPNQRRYRVDELVALIAKIRRDAYLDA